MQIATVSGMGMSGLKRTISNSPAEEDQNHLYSVSYLVYSCNARYDDRDLVPKECVRVENGAHQAGLGPPRLPVIEIMQVLAILSIATNSLRWG